MFWGLFSLTETLFLKNKKKLFQEELLNAIPQWCEHHKRISFTSIILAAEMLEIDITKPCEIKMLQMPLQVSEGFFMLCVFIFVLLGLIH